MTKLLTWAAWVACFMVGLWSAPLLAQQVVRVFGTQSGGTITAALVDSSGRLLVSVAGGAISPTSVGVDASTCAAPGLFENGATTYGVNFTASAVQHCIAGSAVLSTTATGATFTVPILAADGSAAAPSYSFANQTNAGMWLAGVNDVRLGVGGAQYIRMTASTVYMSNGFLNLAGDVDLSRGAANRLDLASGDSLYLVSGGLGVGTTNTVAGTIAASSDISSGGNVNVGPGGGLLRDATFGSGLFTADGKWNFRNSGNTAGVGLDFATDGTLKIRNRAQSADASLTALNLTADKLATSAGGSFYLVNNFAIATAPTVTSAGTNPSVTVSNGSAAFRVNVGTGGTATTIVIAMPAAANGWNCFAENITATAANRGNQRVVFQSGTTTAVTVQNQTISTGVALAFTASDIVAFQCVAF